MLIRLLQNVSELSQYLPRTEHREKGSSGSPSHPRDSDQGRHAELLALTAHFLSCLLLHLFSSSKGIQTQGQGDARPLFRWLAVGPGEVWRGSTILKRDGGLSPPYRGQIPFFTPPRGR